MNDYGYRTVFTVNVKTDDELNEMLAQGWRLVGFTHDHQAYRFIYIFYKEKLLTINPDTAEQIADEQGKIIYTPQPKEKTKRFMFKKALVELGVSPQTADDWIAVRKAKRAAQTETSFRTVASQLKMITDTYGVTADDVVRVAVERNWQGIMLRYFENVNWSDYGTKVGQTDLPFNEQRWE